MDAKTTFFNNIKDYDPSSNDISLLLTIINNRFLDEREKHRVLAKQYEESLQENRNLKNKVEELKKYSKSFKPNDTDLKIGSNTEYHELPNPIDIEENDKENNIEHNINRKFNADTDKKLLDQSSRHTSIANEETLCPEINIISNSHVQNSLLDPWNLSPVKNNKYLNLVQRSPVLNAKFKKKKIQQSPITQISKKCETVADSPETFITDEKNIGVASPNNKIILGKSPEKIKNFLQIETKKKSPPILLRRSPRKLDFASQDVIPITPNTDFQCSNVLTKLDRLQNKKNDDFKSPSMLQNQPNYVPSPIINTDLDNYSFFQFGKGQIESSDTSIVNTSENEVNSGFLTCEKQSYKRITKKDFSQKTKKLKKLKQTRLTPKSFEQPTPKRNLRLDVTSFKINHSETKNYPIEETFCNELVLSGRSNKPPVPIKTSTSSSQIEQEIINLDSDSVPDETEELFSAKYKNLVIKSSPNVSCIDATSSDNTRTPKSRKRVSSIDAEELLNEITSPDQKPVRKKKAKCERETTASFQYVRDAVKKKSDRQKLQGWDCEDCRKYYEGQNLTDSELRLRMNKCSRHRNKFNPNQNETPPGFWNISFPPTPEENRTQIGPPLRKKEEF